MGEAPSFGVDDLHTSSGNGFHLDFKGTETTIVVGERKYVIGGSGKDSALCIGVKVFDQSTGLWENPTILGSKPTPSRDYHAMLIDQDRILIVKNDSTPNDCLWFLEVDTEFVRQQRKKIGTGVVAWSKGVIGYAGKPIVISGPSGVGKGTLISKLMMEYPCMFGFSVSHTTRAPREKEKDGIHYHFMDHSVMEKEISDGKFLEFASVHGNLYGTSVEAVEVVADAGKRCILDIDVQGAKSVRASSLEAIFIFIAPPSFEDLEGRLRGRGTETEEQIQKRLRNARGELEQGRTPGLFDHILVNDDLETCYESLKKLLGLCEAADTKRLSERKTFDLLLVRSASKVDGKIHIDCATLDAENASRDS